MVEVVEPKGKIVKTAQNFYTSLRDLQMHRFDQYNSADDHDIPLGWQNSLEESEDNAALALEDLLVLFPEFDANAAMVFCSSQALTGDDEPPLFLPHIMNAWKNAVGKKELNLKESSLLVRAGELGVTEVELDILLIGALMNRVV